jgi:hypothetical protein
MQGASSKFHLSQLPWLNFELLILNSIALLEFDIRQNLGMMPIICRRCGASCRICGRWLDAAAVHRAGSAADGLMRPLAFHQSAYIHFNTLGS